MEKEVISLEPGLLVTLSTRVEGGVAYKRVDLNPEGPGGIVDADTGASMLEGREVTRWETTRVVTDKEEFAEAGKVRTKCRNLITSACIPTPFGFLICPLDHEPELDQRITEAQAMAALFNGSAQHSRIRITPMRGETTKTKEEAASAVQQQVGGLLADYEAAIGARDIKSIRDLSGKLKQMGKLIQKQSDARGALDRAVAAGRSFARKLKRAGEDGEDIATVLEAASASPITAARFIFADTPEEAEAFRPAVNVELDEPGQEEPAQAELPGIAAGEAEAVGGGGEAEKDEEPAVCASEEEPVTPPESPDEIVADFIAEEAALILHALADALVEFGSYEFDDKGPQEVMDLAPIGARLSGFGAKEEALILAAVCAGNLRGPEVVAVLAERDMSAGRYLELLANPAVASAAGCGDDAEDEAPAVVTGIAAIKLTKASDLLGLITKKVGD